MKDDKAKSSQAEVRLRNTRVGLLVKHSSEKFIFRYDDSYLANKNAVPISIKLPLASTDYMTNHLHAFFDNLIMEGWLLNQAEKNFQIDKKIDGAYCC